MALDRSKPKGLIRRAERVLVGAIMSAVALVLEKLVTRTTTPERR
jgi:hypothetical protein